MADVVVLPGGRSGPVAGMLMYAAAVPERRGATVHRHVWSRQPTDPRDPANEHWVAGEVPPCRLVIGKSFATYAAREVARRSLPAVWLTPLLTVPCVVDALDQATAPFLLAGGTADEKWWDGDRARRLTPHVLEIENADHSLFAPGPRPETIGRVVTAVEEFLDAIKWKERP